MSLLSFSAIKAPNSPVMSTTPEVGNASIVSNTTGFDVRSMVNSVGQQSLPIEAGQIYETVFCGWITWPNCLGCKEALLGGAYVLSLQSPLTVAIGLKRAVLPSSEYDAFPSTTVVLHVLLLAIGTRERGASEVFASFPVAPYSQTPLCCTG